MMGGRSGPHRKIEYAVIPSVAVFMVSYGEVPLTKKIMHKKFPIFFQNFAICVHFSKNPKVGFFGRKVFVSVSGVSEEFEKNGKRFPGGHTF